MTTDTFTVGVPVDTHSNDTTGGAHPVTPTAHPGPVRGPADGSAAAAVEPEPRTRETGAGAGTGGGPGTGAKAVVAAPGRWVWAREALKEQREPAAARERGRVRHRGTDPVDTGVQAPGSLSAGPSGSPVGSPVGSPSGGGPGTAPGSGPSAGHIGSEAGPSPRSVEHPDVVTHLHVDQEASRAPGVPADGPALVDVPPGVATHVGGVPPAADATRPAISGDHAAGRDPATAGAPAPSVDPTPAPGHSISSPDLDVRIGAYEDLLLGGRPCLTARDMAARTGTPLGRVDEFWLAMGFRTAEPDEVIFTVRDLEAYRAWSTLIDSGAIDLATGRSLLRAQSHISDRLALWQVEALVEDVARRQDLDDSQARRLVLESMGDRVDFLEHALVYSWRRQLEALIARVDREVDQRGPDSGKRRFPLTRSLGFVDMVSYTSSSAILGSRLVGLIERFEDASRTAVTAAGGRVVKMIGDAVLFIADDLTTGLRVVTSLIEALGADDQILPVRASFVRGDVFSRSGDVFGPPVNLASRLVDIAPEGRILTDATTAAAIAGGKGGSGYHLEDFPSAELRGFGTVSPYLLARDAD